MARIDSKKKRTYLRVDWIKRMLSHVRFIAVRRRLLVAALFAICLMLLFPGISEAHAILLRSDPAKDAVLPVAPDQVRMWFSETLNPALSTAVVVNGANVHVDMGFAQVSTDDPTEMDVTLKPNLPPAVYVVVWRTDSNDDGHILTGSFLFTVARPDGTVPTLSPGTNPGANALGGSSLSGQYTGQLDGPTFFNLVMITLVELGAVFWVGASFWQIFVLRPSAEDHAQLEETNRQVQQRFERRFALPTLLVLLLANIGVLVGQAISVTGGNWGSAFAPTLLVSLVTSGRFGTFWLMRIVVILLALRLALYPWQLKQRPQRVNTLLSWANLILGLALFIAITMSGHAAAVSQNVVIYALLADWLHLGAAALWVGGMLYIAASYLPVQRKLSIPERAHSLISVLPYYSPWAITGIVIMAVTGPFSATVHLASWEQLLSTAYGRALVVKVLLVGGLLLTSAIHVLLLRPRLKKEYQKYDYVAARQEALQRAPAAVAVSSDQEVTKPPSIPRRLTQEVRLRETRLTKRTRRLTQILGFEPVLGVAVLVCVGLMNVFAGTLSPITAAQQPPTAGTSTAFHTTAKTSDGKYTISLTVNPNTAGPNVFRVSVVETKTGTSVTKVGVALYTTILDMDMGTDNVNLQPDGKGHFSATGDLVMGGHWQIRIQLRTPDNKLHEAIVKLTTP
jgi:copper transport protein